MFETVLLILVASLDLVSLAGPPDLRGLATWYDPCTAHISRADREQCGKQTHLMANGGTYNADAPTVAVDVGLRDEWLGRRVVVFAECGHIVAVEVTDTGLLAAAGEFRQGVGGLGTLRYWPAHWTDVEWIGDEALPVVADFPVSFFRETVCCRPGAAGGLETTVVAIWLVK